MAHALRFRRSAWSCARSTTRASTPGSRRCARATGNSVIHRRGALRQILRALGDNQGVAILIDQHIQTSEAVVVDFFNRPAATTSAVAALALRTGAPIVPVFALPLPGGRYRMIYEHPVVPPPADHPDAVREFTQRCTDVLEMYVRRYPSSWLWMHRRWRDAAARRGHPGHVPGRSARGMTAAPLRGRRAGAELAGRHRHGDAGDRRGPGGAPDRASRGRGAGGVRRRLRGDARRRRRRAAGAAGRSAPWARTPTPCGPAGSMSPLLLHQLVRQRAGRVDAPASPSAGDTAATCAAGC